MKSPEEFLEKIPWKNSWLIYQEKFLEKFSEKINERISGRNPQKKSWIKSPEELLSEILCGIYWCKSSKIFLEEIFGYML